jgi:MFS transporter, ACS family, hexuronate transporter
VKHFRWLILALLFAASVINYIDRQSLSILARRIQDELNISDLGYANVVQMFLLAYMISFLAAGWITDRLGTRRSMALFIGWWSLANMLTGFVGSLRGLAAARFLLGAGESGLYVVAPKVVSQLFPPAQRGLAVGIYSAGATVGATIAPPLIAWLTVSYGWRATFIAGGLMGLIWIVPWLLIYRTPADERSAVAAPLTPQPPDESAAAAEHRAATAAPAGCDGGDVLDYEAPPRAEERWRWWRAFLSTQVLLLLGIRFLTDPVWQFVLFWFPKFLTDVHHLPLETLGRIGWVPFLAADIGGVVGGYASGLLVKRGFHPPDARKWVMAACAVMIPIGALLVPQTRGSNAIVVLVALVAFAEFTWMVTVTALAVDVLPERRFGRMWGVVAAGSGLGGMLFTWAVGHLVTSFSYTPVFVLMGCLHPIAFILVWLVARNHRRAHHP